MSRCTFIAAATVAMASAHAAADDWPQFLGPNGKAVSLESNLRTEFDEGAVPLSWTSELGPGFGGPAVRDGRVFLLDRDAGEADVLRCLALDSGEEEWRFRYEAPGRLSYAGSRGVPAVTEDYVYTVGGFGHVFCIDRETHEPVWSTNFETEFGGEMPRWGWSSSPLLHEDLMILAPLGPEAGLVAVERFTGEEVWRTEGLGSTHSTPALWTLGGVTQVMLLTRDGSDGRLCSFAIEDGQKLWESNAYTNRIPIPPPLALDERRLFLTGGYEAGSVLLDVTVKDGDWTVEEKFRIERGSQLHVPALHEDHLYMIANENANSRGSQQAGGGMMCLTLDGKELWRTGAAPYLGRGGFVYAQGHLFVQDGIDGTLRIVRPNPESFEVVTQTPVFGEADGRRDQQMWAPLALADGRLLMRSQGELRCLDLRAQAE